ncbi:hypothetical protein CJU90_4581 [Yarrowia sp. C11]|nr:hypothetical protein CJU90_4581 [Yarrowia sp. C11]
MSKFSVAAIAAILASAVVAAPSPQDPAAYQCHATCGTMILDARKCAQGESWDKDCLCDDGTAFQAAVDPCMDCGASLWNDYGKFLEPPLAYCGFQTKPKQKDAGASSAASSAAAETTPAATSAPQTSAAAETTPAAETTAAETPAEPSAEPTPSSAAPSSAAETPAGSVTPVASSSAAASASSAASSAASAPAESSAAQATPSGSAPPQANAGAKASYAVGIAGAALVAALI